ncbi:DUF4189 domain-containing protein [Lysobacter sp. CFH 32150]|uniref:DUF4189 domain-containing protein n=1 Tax=Lysobacter sp. CFH 32150 TaxID=2927128 RepID=UPI001FA75869|nr:DUF4189 domain-containing protein [Lysobacter sp. CFH 32150]MCI4566751.1 DUF4189 domain-containing protein [Lysobacter sp. CFH 32150]
MTKWWFPFGLLALNGVAWGQTACPGGVSPGDPRCGPSPNASVPLPRGPQWQLTWGAIASDSTTGDVGTTVGHLSRGEAKREALNKCAAGGAKKCRVVLAYKNQCAVYVAPTEKGESVAGVAFAQGGPSIDVASQLGMSACREARGGGECSVIYSDCTRPVQEN